jgi:hypothetical protein
MTVKELIEKLNEYPVDATIEVLTEEYDGCGYTTYHSSVDGGTDW